MSDLRHFKCEIADFGSYECLRMWKFEPFALNSASPPSLLGECPIFQQEMASSLIPKLMRSPLTISLCNILAFSVALAENSSRKMTKCREIIANSGDVMAKYL